MGRCIVEVVFLDHLCQDFNNEYVGRNISAHCSLRGACAVRHTIIDILILVQIWSIGVLEERCDQWWDGTVTIKAAYAEMPRVLLFNRVPSRWTILSALHLRTPRTGAILGGSIFTLLVRRHVWLESGAKTFYSGWGLDNKELK